MSAVQTVPFTVHLFELSSKTVAWVALPFPLWHHRQMFYTSQSTWGCTSHTRCSPVARERSVCQWWVSGRWPPAKISVKRKWCQTGDTSCLVSIHVGGIQVLWNQNDVTYTQPGSPNFNCNYLKNLVLFTLYGHTLMLQDNCLIHGSAVVQYIAEGPPM